MLWQIAARALDLDTNTILDFGFWAKEERDDYRARARKIGARSEIVLMEVEEKELLKRDNFGSEHKAEVDCRQPSRATMGIQVVRMQTVRQ